MIFSLKGKQNVQAQEVKVKKSKVVHQRRSLKRRFLVILGAVAFIIGVLLYLLTKFNTWSLTNKIIWQSPIIIQTPVYIKKVQPRIIEKKVVVTPTPTPLPRTEKQIIFAHKHGQILWKIYGLESTWGKADSCRIKEKGYAGFGVMYKGEIICYPTFEKAVERAEHWLVKLGVEKDLATALCTYNTGIAQPNCIYYQKYLTL